MKTKIIFLLTVLATVSIQATIKDPITNNIIDNNKKSCVYDQMKGVFDGADEYGYTFILTLDDGEGVIFTFNKLDEAVSEVYNLESENLIGETFLITFELLQETSEGEQKEIYTITDLEVL